MCCCNKLSGWSGKLQLHSRTLDSNSLQKEQKEEYENYLKSPSVRGIKLWEILPEKVQKATTKVTSRVLLEIYVGYINSQFYNNIIIFSHIYLL